MNSHYRAHKKLDVWRESVALATHIYKVTENFPKAEAYGLTSQMRRSVVSVPSNIAEGAARSSSREFVHFLNIAGGSLSELDTQLEIACNLNFLTDTEKQEIDNKIDSIAAKLAGLIKHIYTTTEVLSSLSLSGLTGQSSVFWIPRSSRGMTLLLLIYDAMYKTKGS